MLYRLMFLISLTVVLASCSGIKEDDELIVDGISIKKIKVDKVISDQMAYYANYGQKISAEDSITLRKRIVEGMVDELVLSVKGKNEGFKPDTAEVNSYIKQIKTAFTSDSALNNHMAKFGLTYDDYVTEMERSSVARLYFKSVVIDPLTVADSFYVDSLTSAMKTEKVKVSHILIKVDQNATNDLRQNLYAKTEGIRKQIMASKGKNFADLAKRYSDDKSSAVNGGSMPFFGKKEMVQPFEDASYMTEIGQISEIVTTPFGYHIIKVEDKQVMAAPAEEVNKAALNMTRRRASEKLLKELRSEFEIIRHEEKKS